MVGSLKAGLIAGLSVGAAALIVIGAMALHARGLETRLEALQSDLNEKVAEVLVLESAIALQNTKVADMERTAEALRENGRQARLAAQEEVKAHQEVIAALRRDRPATCEQEGLRQKMLGELLPAK